MPLLREAAARYEQLFETPHQKSTKLFNMKRAIYVLIALVIASCSEKKLVGFGDAKLGMSINEFNQRFGTTYPEDELLYENFDTLNVDKNLTLKKGSVHFTNLKLTKIVTVYDAKLFTFLKQYGIKEINNEGVIFTSDDSIFCTAGKKFGKYILIGIIDQKNDRS